MIITIAPPIRNLANYRSKLWTATSHAYYCYCTELLTIQLFQLYNLEFSYQSLCIHQRFSNVQKNIRIRNSKFLKNERITGNVNVEFSEQVKLSGFFSSFKLYTNTRFPLAFITLFRGHSFCGNISNTGFHNNMYIIFILFYLFMISSAYIINKET